MKVGYVPEGSRWVPAVECKIFMYVDKTYSDFKKTIEKQRLGKNPGIWQLKIQGLAENVKTKLDL